jgi:hypothetical protein
MDSGFGEKIAVFARHPRLSSVAGAALIKPAGTRFEIAS